MLAVHRASPFASYVCFPDVEPEILASEDALEQRGPATFTSRDPWHDFIGTLLPAVTNDPRPIRTPPLRSPVAMARFLLCRSQEEASTWATARRNTAKAIGDAESAEFWVDVLVHVALLRTH